MSTAPVLKTPERARRNALTCALGSLVTAPLALGIGVLTAVYGTEPDLRLAAWAAGLTGVLLVTSVCGFAVVAGRAPVATSFVLVCLTPLLALGGLVYGVARAAGGAGSLLLSVTTPVIIGLCVAQVTVLVHQAARTMALSPAAGSGGARPPR
ncbi:hypothetical protein [Cellulomonas olei]|uniref:hypothetical protein n=1 Tax=Cellulomonas sp. P4 TaxID=3142533 RepID=UPI0031BA540F